MAEIDKQPSPLNKIKKNKKKQSGDAGSSSPNSSSSDLKNVVDSAASKEKIPDLDNDYLVLVNKKIRSINKKLRTIDEIEKKVAQGAKINYDQQQIINNKNATLEAMKTLENLRGKLLKVAIEDEKQEKRWKTRAVKIRERTEVGPLINLLHLANVVTEGSPLKQRLLQDKKLGITDADFGALVSLANAISKKQPNSQSEASAEHSRRFLALAEDGFLPRYSYKLLKEKLYTITASPLWIDFQGPAPSPSTPTPTQESPQQQPPQPQRQPEPQPETQTKETKPAVSKVESTEPRKEKEPALPEVVTTTNPESTVVQTPQQDQTGAEAEGEGEEDEGQFEADQGQSADDSGDFRHRDQGTRPFRGRGRGSRGRGRGRFMNGGPRGGSFRGNRGGSPRQGSFSGSPRGGNQQQQQQQQ